MDFNFNVVSNDGQLDIKLEGYLDASNASGLLEEIKKYIGQKIAKIVFDVEGLDYIASAGLRVIIFTKQKIGYEADVILKKPNETVLSVIDMTGLDNFVSIEN